MGQFEAIIGVNFWTALFVLLNTLTIFFVGKKFLFGPITKLIEGRQKEIDDMYRDAGNAKEQAEALQSQYEEKLAAAADEAERLVKEATVRSQLRQEEILRQANAQADAIRDKASADIRQEKKKAINDAKNEISSIAVAIAGKVVGKTISESDQQELVEQFIDGLGDAL